MALQQRNAAGNEQNGRSDSGTTSTHQFKAALNSMSYEDQSRALQPDMPVLFNMGPDGRLPYEKDLETYRKPSNESNSGAEYANGGSTPNSRNDGVGLPDLARKRSDRLDRAVV